MDNNVIEIEMNSKTFAMLYTTILDATRNIEDENVRREIHGKLSFSGWFGLLDCDLFQTYIGDYSQAGNILTISNPSKWIKATIKKIKQAEENRELKAERKRLKENVI